jgi:tRNA(adenine34) deaminase
MCAGAILQARVGRVVFGNEDPKGGAVSSLYSLLEDGRLNHRVEVTSGVLQAECQELLRRFFRERRKNIFTTEGPENAED